MELFTKLEITIMVSVVGFLVFVILLLSLFELLSRRKEKKNLLENSENIEKEDSSLEEQKVEIEQKDNLIEDNVGEITVQKTEKIAEKQDEGIVPNLDIENLKEELFEEKSEEVVSQENTLKIEEPEILIEDLDDPIVPSIATPVETLEVEPDLQKKAQLELVEMEEELKHPMTLEDTISSLEAIEEKNAIISYQELVDVTKEMQIIPEDVGDEPISITEVYEKFTGEAMEHPSVDDIYQASLVNGYENENLNEIQLENTANLEKLDKEIRKTNKVLNMLNELKKNLD